MVELSRLPARQAFVLEAAGVPSVSCVSRAVLHRLTSSSCSLKVGQSEARAAHVLGVRVSGRLCFCRRQSRRGWGGGTFGQARGNWRLTLRGVASRPPPVFGPRFSMKMAGGASAGTWLCRNVYLLDLRVFASEVAAGGAGTSASLGRPGAPARPSM